MRTGNLDHSLLDVVLGAAFVAITLIGGCTQRNHQALERARAAYTQTNQDPDIATYAPDALQEAEAALREAEWTWENTHDQQEVSHLAYVTERKVSIARATAEENRAEAEIQRLAEERKKVLLEARAREADQAKARAHQLELELEELKAKQTDRGLVFTLEDVLFEYDKANLKPGAMQNLYPLVTFLKEHPERDVLIEGHTDSAGSESYNLNLSQHRTESVRDFLALNGVDPTRITTRGYGEAYPVTSNETEAGRQQNRRVEVVILHEGEQATHWMR